MASLVSILIPAYNAERLIAETIRSALAQTWPHKEIIVVDDGSKDGTVAVAERFAPEGVRVVRQKNQGASAARNTAFSLCKGEYIQWLDADDLLSPDKIERQMVLAEQLADPRLLLSSNWGYFFSRPGKAVFHRTPLCEDLSAAEWLIRKLSGNYHMQTATWLASRQLTEAAGPWDSRLMSDDDGEYFCRVLLASRGVRFEPEGRVYYRVTGGGSWGNLDNSRKKLEAHWMAMKLHIQYLRSLEDSDRARAASVTYLQNWLQYYYPDQTDLIGEFHKLAHELGGTLNTPRMSWKYAWIQKLFGWNTAKRVQGRYNQCKSSILRWWDSLRKGA